MLPCKWYFTLLFSRSRPRWFDHIPDINLRRMQPRQPFSFFSGMRATFIFMSGLRRVEVLSHPLIHHHSGQSHSSANPFPPVKTNWPFLLTRNKEASCLPLHLSARCAPARPIPPRVGSLT